MASTIEVLGEFAKVLGGAGIGGAFVRWMTAREGRLVHERKADASVAIAKEQTGSHDLTEERRAREGSHRDHIDCERRAAAAEARAARAEERSEALEQRVVLLEQDVRERDSIIDVMRVSIEQLTESVNQLVNAEAARARREKSEPPPAAAE